MKREQLVSKTDRIKCEIEGLRDLRDAFKRTGNKAVAEELGDIANAILTLSNGIVEDFDKSMNEQ